MWAGKRLPEKSCRSGGRSQYTESMEIMYGLEPKAGCFQPAGFSQIPTKSREPSGVVMP